MLDFEDIEMDNLTKSQEFNAVVNKIKNIDEVGDKPYMDTDLGHSIWFNGVDWVDALGNVK